MTAVMTSDRNLGLINRIWDGGGSTWCEVRSPDGTLAMCSDYLQAIRLAQMQARTVPGLTTVSVGGVVLDTFAMLVVL